MDENPYQSPHTPGAAPDRIPQRGNPYSLPAIAYFFLTIALPVLLFQLFERQWDGKIPQPLTGILLIASPCFFLSGLYVLWKSWRPPPE
jgi:hypothetical protein